MSTGNSTGQNAQSKPQKPYENFPLFPHGSGRWAKKIRGKTYYFGHWRDGWERALKSYQDQAAALHSGRKPKEASTGVRVRDIANKFRVDKEEAVAAGELSPRTLADYVEAADLLCRVIDRQRLADDLDGDDFAQLRKVMQKKWGIHRLAKMMQAVRCIFSHARKARLIGEPNYGTGFDRPTKKAFRKHRAESDKKFFELEEVNKLLGAAKMPMRAMMLLALNCGFGNHDCGTLPMSALDLDRGWIDFPRPKTGIDRRCPLWPETIEALREAIAGRPNPTDHDDAELVFLTKYGGRWSKDSSDNPVSKEFRKLMQLVGIKGHRGFYSLRHVHRTVSDEARDQPAADFIMGHESTHMSSRYREGISDERLKAVVEHVRRWVFAGPGPQPEV